MAGDWIPWVKGLAKRPEVIRIAAMLKQSRREIASSVMEVWEWCDSEGDFDPVSRNCHIYGVTWSAMEDMFSVTGLSQAMCSQGWLIVEDGDHLIFPRLVKWIGKYCKERLLANERKRKSRVAQTENATEDVTEMSRNKRDKNVTREEKRRVQKKKDQKKDAADAADARASCFETWWVTYPKARRCNKQTAYKRYISAGKILTGRGMARAEAVAFLQERVATFAASSLGRSRFAPAADVWLNKGRYDDVPEAWLRG